MELVIEDLGNTRDKFILTELNHYPIVSVKAHTRPFEHRWMNIVAAIIVPLGLFLYFRMWKFRLRLHHDLNVIRDTNQKIVARIDDMFPAAEPDAPPAVEPEASPAVEPASPAAEPKVSPTAEPTSTSADAPADS